jgi:site-specific DNA-methyltransferase (adenine-specific)
MSAVSNNKAEFLAKLYLGDCLEVMKQIPDNSVDMVLCDPPYGTTACKWDTVIPFEPLWREYERVTKPNAAIVIFGSEPFSSNLRMSAPRLFKYDWIWEKNCPTNHTLSKCMPLKSHEIISVFSKGVTYHKNRSKNPMRYYPQGLVELSKPKAKMAEDKFNPVTCNETPGKFRGAYETTHTNFPRSVLKFDWVAKRVHPSQKPVELLEYLIKTYSRPGDTILDNTMGSGSTGVAAKNTDRHFIGIEKESEYFDIAEKRIGSA